MHVEEKADGVRGGSIWLARLVSPLQDLRIARPLIHPPTPPAFESGKQQNKQTRAALENIAARSAQCGAFHSPFCFVFCWVFLGCFLCGDESNFSSPRCLKSKDPTASLVRSQMKRRERVAIPRPTRRNPCRRRNS